VHRLFGADLVFCLGETSMCRFIPDAEVAAAVSRATGRIYTAGNHEERYGCRYHFANSSESVDTDWNPQGKYTPIWGHRQFTLDGLRALYGEGDVTVEVAGGTFTVLSLGISGARGSLGQKIGTEVFRAARPHLS
jgi:hypothetical protein